MKNLKTIKNLLLVVTILSMFSCREKIDSANIGLLIEQYGSDKGNPVTLTSGTVWYNPWTQDVEQIPGFVQHKEFGEVKVTDKSGTEWTMTPTLDYILKRAEAPKTYNKYRKPLEILEETVLKTIAKEACRFIINTYTTDSIMSSRGNIEKQIKDRMTVMLNNEGFDVENFTSGLYPPKSITNAINAKNQAIQDAIRIDNEVKSTQAQAKKQVAKAKGDAEALLTTARAEAEANKLKQSTLTPMLIQQQWIDKWNGALPTTTTNGNLMIGLPNGK